MIRFLACFPTEVHLLHVHLPTRQVVSELLRYPLPECSPLHGVPYGLSEWISLPDASGVKLEELYKEDTNEAAIEAGKLLVKEILHNTIDKGKVIKETE